MTRRDTRLPIDPDGIRALLDDPVTALRPIAQDMAFGGSHAPNRGRQREPSGHSALPRFNPYSIPQRSDPKAVDCPYCVKRPRNLQAHCRAVHPDKPEAR